MSKGPKTEKNAGPGRPRTFAERILGTPVRLETTQRSKLAALGGSSWARAAIDAEFNARCHDGGQAVHVRPELPTEPNRRLPGVPKLVPATVQLTPTHVERLDWLGGAAWLRWAIDHAHGVFFPEQTEAPAP